MELLGMVNYFWKKNSIVDTWQGTKDVVVVSLISALHAFRRAISIIIRCFYWRLWLCFCMLDCIARTLSSWWWWWWIVFVVWLTGERRLHLISSLDHCQRFSPSRISDTPRAGFEPVQNLSSDLVEKTCVNFTSRSKINKWFKKSFCPQEFPVPPKSYEGCKKGIVTKGVFKILSSNID